MFYVLRESISQTQCFLRQVWMNWSDNLERGVISWRMSGQLLSVILFPVLRFWEAEECSTAVCHQSSEVWPGRKIGPAWVVLLVAPAGPRWPSSWWWPGWPQTATCLRQGKPPLLTNQCLHNAASVTASFTLCSAARRDLGSDFYRSG